MLIEQQQKEREKVMLSICQSFQKNSLPMVLKGGTALRFCYASDRFSEDLDFDSAKPLNLERSIKNVFLNLGKSQPKLRNPVITLVKKTDTVRRYRIEYGDQTRLKIETSLRGTPKDSDLTIINGILTYKIPVLISQKLGALQGRTTARDLHDVIFLFENYMKNFDKDQKAMIIDLNNTQSEVISRFNPAYDEDPVLETNDLIMDLVKLSELVEPGPS